MKKSGPDRSGANSANATTGIQASTPRSNTSGLNARDPEGQVIGGLRAIVAMYWLRIEVLWVHDDARGKGIGSQLLAEAERMGSDLGAKDAALETFEWQAPRFYEKHGYVEVARLDKYVGEFYLAIMRKGL